MARVLDRESHLVLMQMLVRILETEKRIEIARKTLASNSFFEPYDIFKVLDSDRKFYITEADIHSFVRKIYPEIRKQSISYVFSIMSKGSDRIDFDGLAAQILPKDYGKTYKNIYYLNKQSIDFNPELSMDITIDFANLIKCIHDEHMMADRAVFAVQAAEISGSDAYNDLTPDDKGFISPEDLVNILKQFFHYVGNRSLT